MTVLSKEDFEKKYEIETHYIDELPEWLITKSPSTIYINQGINSDSRLPTVIPEEDHYNGYNFDKTTIYNILTDTKVVKSDAELDVMRWATKITVEGHVDVLRKIKPGMKES